MASILSRNPLSTPNLNNQAAPGFSQPVQPQAQNDPLFQINAMIQQVLGSPDPNAAFQQILKASPEAQNAMNIIMQYGNGDPKTAFDNFAVAQSKQAFGEEIKKKFGL